MEKINKIVLDGLEYEIEDSKAQEKLIELDNKIGTGGSVSNLITEISYSNLKLLRNNSELVPGMKYRIIDYVTTTITTNTKSAQHQFDIIVEALDKNKLSELCSAIQHEGDTYFSNDNLLEWKIWYDIDNDTTKYDWADSINGKGVIYRMIDEKNNDCPYDFKNILFYDTSYTTDTTVDNYYYTFTYRDGSFFYDGSTSSVSSESCHDNIIKSVPSTGSTILLSLRKNIFKTTHLYSCRNNILGNNCYNNIFGNNCRYNKLGDDCYDNTFGNNCRYNKLGDDCNNNKLGDSCSDNKLGNSCSSNSFEYDCNRNIFSNECVGNTFGDYCSYITLGQHCFDNKFTRYCSFFNLGKDCSSNEFLADNSGYNTFGDSCNSNIFYSTCYNNIFGNFFSDNVFYEAVSTRYVNQHKSFVTLDDQYYDDGNNALVPIKHPDLSTQPSILPYKFIGQYVYEQLIPIIRDSKIQSIILLPVSLAVDKPAFISASTLGIGSTSNIDIEAVNNDTTAILLKDSLSKAVHKYIKVTYTDASPLIIEDNDSIYYGYNNGGSSSSSSESDIDFGISESDNTEWIYKKSTDTLTLNKYDDILLQDSVPNKYKNSSTMVIGDSVTGIGDYAFSDCTGFTSITIPYSVTSIGNNAFSGCTGLTSITIPNSVKIIEDGAFWGCSGLTSIEIPNSITSIEYETFRGCGGLTSVTIPNSVTSIGDYAFWGCSGLTGITIPNSVTAIKGYAFSRCINLTSIEIPDSITSIEQGVFSDCSGLTNIEIPESITSIGDYAFSGCAFTNIEIPESITSIGRNAFYGCTNLTEIEIPSSVNTIRESTFSRCYNLTNVILSDGLNYIETNAFYNTNLKEIIIPNNVIDIEPHAFGITSGEFEKITFNCDIINSNKPSRWIGTLLINEFIFGGNVTSIPSSVFGESSKVKSVIIENGNDRSISAEAFYRLTTLESVLIGDGVTSIGDRAFSGCSGLTSITIPNSVTSIGYSAFYGCINLTTIEIPDSVTSISDKAFSGCSGLTSLVCNSTVPPILGGPQVFENSGGGNVTVYVPSSSVSAYENDSLWSACIIKPIGEINIIKFTINGQEYQAEEGMTWGDWVNSEYNIDSYYIDDSDRVISQPPALAVVNEAYMDVSSTDLIEANHAYDEGPIIS